MELKIGKDSLKPHPLGTGSYIFQKGKQEGKTNCHNRLWEAGDRVSSFHYFTKVEQRSDSR